MNPEELKRERVVYLKSNTVGGKPAGHANRERNKKPNTAVRLFRRR